MTSAPRRYEVENKFPIADLPDLEGRLAEAGAVVGSPILQVDTYLSHPSRDFAATDEALRLRRVGEANVLTYKGPRHDTATRTREEIELEVSPGEEAATAWIELLSRLGFRVVAEVRKRRRPVTLPGSGAAVTGALDEVETLGSFLELEIMAGSSELATAEERLLDLARRLALPPPEPRTYLELLLERGG